MNFEMSLQRSAIWHNSDDNERTCSVVVSRQHGDISFSHPVYFPNEEKVFICEPWTMKFFVGDDTQHIHTHVRTQANA